MADLLSKWFKNNSKKDAFRNSNTERSVCVCMYVNGAEIKAVFGVPLLEQVCVDHVNASTSRRIKRKDE